MASDKDIPKPRRVYERLSVDLSPALNQVGLRPLKLAYPAWRSPPDQQGNAVFLSLQVDRKAGDAYAGGSFRIELDKSRGRRPALGLNGRALFFQLLTEEERQGLLARQNRIIDSLPQPPPEQVQLYPAGGVRDIYLSYFEHQSKFDAVRCWLRYRTVDDLRGWASALSPLVRPLVTRAATYLSMDRRVLGQGYLLPEP